MWLTLLKDRPKSKPFFFWFASFDAHRKWQVDSSNRPHDPATVIVPPSLRDTKQTREDIAAYYNEIARLDYNIGLLETELKQQGAAENTMIIFMSDNGRPFPGSKTRLNDAGVKTPFIIRWPKGVQAGSECHSLVSTIDIAPTVLELAGVASAPTIQGKSFKKLLKSPKASFRSYVFTEHNWHDYEAYERAVCTKDYLYIINRRPKLANQGPLDAVNSASFKALKEAEANGALTPVQKDIFLSPRDVEELFAVQKDKLQIHNLISDPNYAAVRNKLKAVLVQWQNQTGDTEPSHLTADWYDRINGKNTSENNRRGEMPGYSKNADRINASGPF